MKSKLLLLLPFFLLIGHFSNAQFIHYGIKTFASPYLEMEFYQYDQNEYVFYFANENNETIRFDGLDTSRIKSMKPYPAVYVRYDLNIRWFVQAEAFYFFFKNEASYRNSVDLSEYSQTFNSTNNQEILNYNSLQLKWRFSGIRVFVGYTFMKTKSIRPYVFSGFSTMFLMNLKMGDTYMERDYRNLVLFSHLATFAPVSFYNTSGFGLQYQGIRLSGYVLRSTGYIDIFASEYKKNTGLSLDEQHPNYKYMFGQFISLSVNLFSKSYTKPQIF
ncbi:MAG: hypothetical protein JXL97_06670 [Bacteroidales bacterium]|nr:hypothetical protein [Bacteroidales bacterium]